MDKNQCRCLNSHLISFLQILVSKQKSCFTWGDCRCRETWHLSGLLWSGHKCFQCYDKNNTELALRFWLAPGCSHATMLHSNNAVTLPSKNVTTLPSIIVINMLHFKKWAMLHSMHEHKIILLYNNAFMLHSIIPHSRISDCLLSWNKPQKNLSLSSIGTKVCAYECIWNFKSAVL